MAPTRARALLLFGGLTLAGPPGCRPELPPPLVAFLGDSLTSGWRLPEKRAYPALVARRLRARGRPIRVLNAGVSADTMAQGLARLPQVLENRPDVLVVALGINDALRGLPLDQAEADLRAILKRAQASGVTLVLAGIRIPESEGVARARAFAAIYPRLAAEYRGELVPFLLEGVAGRPDLNFPDLLHPNAAGQARVAENVWPVVERALVARAPLR